MEIEKPYEFSHHRFAGSNRHSLRDGVTVSFVLAPETGLFVSVIGVMRRHHRPFDISVGMSGPHDFAVRWLAARPAACLASIAFHTQRS